jgi:hypothetical protein
MSGTIPGVRPLAVELGVNHKTVEAALTQLEQEGLPTPYLPHDSPSEHLTQKATPFLPPFYPLSPPLRSLLQRPQGHPAKSKFLAIMKINKQIKTILPLAAFAGLALAGSANAVVIYFDDFDGSGASGLHDTTPDTTTGGVKWVASAQYNADGSYLNDTGGAMTLAFTPVDGFIYTLDISVNPIGTDWVAVGYGQTTAGNYSGGGRAWHLIRSSSAVASKHFTALSGTGGLVAYPSPLDTQAGELDLRTVLDTTGGTGNWTATYFAKLPASGSYTQVRAATSVAEDITAVGFGAQHSGSNQTGTLTSFSLSDNTVIPEPSTTALLGLGGLALILRRRK